jgi:PhnB protein
MNEQSPMQSVTPTLIVDGAKKALEFYTQAFGAKETARVEGPDGKIMHSTLDIGNSTIMVHDAFPEMGAHAPTLGQNVPAYLYVMVPDVDAAFDRAVKAGATSLRGVETEFYGHRTGILNDPFGHTWTLATEVEDVSMEEVERRMAEMMPS